MHRCLHIFATVVSFALVFTACGGRHKLGMAVLPATGRRVEATFFTVGTSPLETTRHNISTAQGNGWDLFRIRAGPAGGGG